MKKQVLEKDLQKIVSISKKYGAEKVFLFGSCVDDVKHAKDIDIAVKGIEPRKFFEYFGKVSFAINDEVDIVDLDDLKGYFFKKVVTEGKLLYERQI
jgi:predicted nucleotidyltransferase